MTTITTDIYRRVAEQLLKAIDDKSFFNGTIEYDTDEFYSTLRTTLIIHRQKSIEPTLATDTITEIVPVWWEFTMTTERGDELTDFSWRELAEHLI